MPFFRQLLAAGKMGNILNKLHGDMKAYDYKNVRLWTLPKELKRQNQARARRTHHSFCC